MAIPYASSSSVIIASRQPKPYNVVSLNNHNATPFLGFSVSAASSSSSSSSSLRATSYRSLQIRCQAQTPTQAEAEAPVKTPTPAAARTPAIVARIPPEQSWMFEETGFRGPDIWNTTWYPKAVDHVMTEKTWYVVDATDKILGRLASTIAIYIRGKNLATFTPSVDMGAFVIVVNAEKVAVSGKKRTQKLYRRHSGRPGGMTVETFDQLQNRIPERIIEHAVRGMLPKGRLGRQLFNHLKVYKGPEHPHEAQKPIDLPLKDKRIQREE